MLRENGGKKINIYSHKQCNIYKAFQTIYDFNYFFLSRIYTKPVLIKVNYLFHHLPEFKPRSRFKQ